MKLYTYSDYEFINFKGKKDSTQFDINDNGAILISAVNKPTAEEIKSFEMDKIRIRAAVINNIVWLTFAIGDLPITDAPFSLHLTKNLTDRNLFKEKLKTIRIAFVDTATGEIAIQLQYFLDEKFIDELSEMILMCYRMPFDREEYFNLIDSICRSIPADVIFKDSSVEYNSFKDEGESEEEESTQIELNFENDICGSFEQNEMYFEKTIVQPEDRLLAENDEYAFYGLWLGGKMIRKNKLTGEAVVFCNETSAGPAAIFGDKIYWYDSFGILSDKYIYRSNLDGSEKEKMDILDNSKRRMVICNGFARSLSIDMVKEMHIKNNKLNLIVERCFHHEQARRKYKYLIEFETPNAFPKFHMFEDELLNDDTDGFFYPKEFKNKKELMCESEEVLTKKRELIIDVAHKKHEEKEAKRFVKSCFEQLKNDLRNRGFSKHIVKLWERKYFKY